MAAGMARLTRQDITRRGPSASAQPPLPSPTTASHSPASPALCADSSSGWGGSPQGPRRLPFPHCTDHQGVSGGGGLQPAQLHMELVVTQVSTLGLSDEEVGVPLPIPHAHMTGIQGTAVMRAHGLRLGFALRNGEKAVSCPERPFAPPGCNRGQIHQVHVVT